MAIQSPGKVLAYNAETAVTAFRAVKAGSTPGDEVVHCTAPTEVPVGVAQFDADAGRNVDVAMLDSGSILKMVASAAIAAGAEVAVTTGGKIVTASAASSHYVIGHAEVAAGADGDVIPVRIDAGFVKA